MRQGLLLVVLFLMVAGTIAFVVLRDETYEVRITQQQLQQKIDPKFPITKTHLLILKVTWQNPTITLAEGSSRATVSFDAELILRDDKDKPTTLKGTAQASSAIRYQEEKYQFYLVEPKVEQLNLPGVPAKWEGKIAELFNKYASEVFDQLPVYTIPKTDLPKAAARMFLKSVTVENGELVAVFGL